MRAPIDQNTRVLILALAVLWPVHSWALPENCPDARSAVEANDKECRERPMDCQEGDLKELEGLVQKYCGSHIIYDNRERKRKPPPVPTIRKNSGQEDK